jgi:putative component of membrane protein insertase Oxa1/YidC/SpoIIIJ protein YidD
MRWIAIVAVLAYRALIRPFHRRVCLFEESCSAYAIRTLRVAGFDRALPMIRARLHACRMPAGACFVLDGGGRARLISARSGTGSDVPPAALALLAREAELHHASAADRSGVVGPSTVPGAE